MSPTDASFETPGDSIGPFRLIERIGAGGFGVVWKAERTEPFRQTVAVKVIKAGMDTQNVLARFDAERRTLARMEHPGIARVLDGGMTPAGRPYFVMEFVDGVPITRFADAARLDLRARVSMLAEVADAVQHAHAKGVIHRDLKPSNLLVSRDEHGSPRVKVIDFGIAKSLTDDGASRTMTEAGQFVGTLEYVSPEQADSEGLEVDTRSDVYALGAVLYELLVGAAPFGRFDEAERSTSSRAEALRRLAEVLPERPSRRVREAPAATCAARAADAASLARTLAAELEWIPLKALRKSPEERYASAAALAADLRSYLDGGSLAAGPESALYRLRALARRNRALFAAAGSVAAILVAATGVSAYFAWNESVARAEATRKEEEARHVATFQARILDALDPAWVGAEIMQDLVENHARVLMMTEPDADARKARREKLWAEQGLVNRPDLGRAIIERWILKPTSEGIESEFARYPVAAAAMRHTLASRRLALGDAKSTKAARADIEFALSERRRLLGDRHPDTLDSMLVAGRILWTLDERRPALALLDECARGRAATLGGDDRATLTAVQVHASLLAEFDPADAVARLEAVVETRRRLQGAGHGETAGAERDLGGALLAADRAAEAEPILRTAHAAFVAAIGPEAPGTVATLGALVGCLSVLGRFDEALPLARSYVAAANKQSGARDATTLQALGLLATILAARTDPAGWAEALELATAARIGAERMHGAASSITARCRLAEVRALLANGSRDEALRRLGEIEGWLRDADGAPPQFAREVRALRGKTGPVEGATRDAGSPAS